MLVAIPSLISGGGRVASIVDSYSETNQDGSTVICGTCAADSFGQTFTAIAGNLSSVKFYLNAGGSPTGSVTAKLYALTGSFGTTAVPTGAALATSDTFDPSVLTGSFALYSFTFSGANQYAMMSGTHYGIALEYLGGLGGSNFIRIGQDNSSPSHAGNDIYRQQSNQVWITDGTGVDVCFYVYAL